MLFNSYEFILLFLPVTFVVFFTLGKLKCNKLATAWLVLASLFFYGWWDYHYVPLLLMSILFNYFVGKQIENRANKKAILVGGIAADLLLLGYFKYADFFISTVNDLSGSSLGLLNIVLPLGISFFTFTQIAYLVDVYRGIAKNISLLYYFEFVTIFPHLIAGPIISYKEMLPQFIRAETFAINHKNIAIGLAIFAIGLTKKVMIADNLAVWANIAFNNSENLTFLAAWIGAISYSLQLYFDFSGYSEMAIGLGLLFNLSLPMNFNSPYQATSIVDFWRRWHMTLGSWVKEYMYIPLGGNRHGELCKMRNLLVSMLLIGLWHGAGWTFVLWGGTHGLLLVINHQWRRFNIKLPHLVNWVMTFSCVVVCWVLFRAESIHEALNVLRCMTDIYHFGLPDKDFIWNNFGFLEQYGINFGQWIFSESLPRVLVTLSALMVLVVCVPNPLGLRESQILFRHKALPILLGMLLGLSLLMCNVQNSEFLYFQF